MIINDRKCPLYRMNGEIFNREDYEILQSYIKKIMIPMVLYLSKLEQEERIRDLLYSRGTIRNLLMSLKGEYF